jgi:UDP-N-acetylglucosamine diphosphorylase/glucosamine-1-phosphate N-acetyltransferase
MRLYLVEGDARKAFRPLSLTRPVGELLYGCALLREHLQLWAGRTADGYVGASNLAGFDEDGTPPVLDASDVEAPCLIVSSTFAPRGTFTPGGTAALRCSGRAVGWYLADRSWTHDDAALESLTAPDGPTDTVEVDGDVLGTPWELVDRNPGRIAADVRGASSEIPEGVTRIGTGIMTLGNDVDLGPGTVLDTRDGPIVLSDGVRVEPLSHLVGPLFVGPQTTLLGGSIRATSVGPRCKVRGEVDSSVILGFCNKAHDGYLGHAYLGRWVNLGALTTNSDLKNNYSPVRVDRGSGPEDTGQTKVGVFLGDHVKTGIGTLLTTGCVIEAGSNVFGGTMLPRYVPPFSWGSGSDLQPYDLERFLSTTEVVMGRRDQTLSEGMTNLLRRTWKASRSTGS